jgi:glycosyltransferase involved in cell wall biosynthesis
LSNIALYTTIYPSVQKFLSEWYESVRNQTNQDFDLVIGVDSLDILEVVESIGVKPQARWLFSMKGDTPVQVRQRAFEFIVSNYQAVIFVDSDDILLPERVEIARESLKEFDVIASSMCLIDTSGKELDFSFRMPLENDPAKWLVRANVFGLSNTAYHSHILSLCLPIPSECRLVDWYLATNAWLLGGMMGFDSNITMAYRQHENNVARILPPFTSRQILMSASFVENHYKIVMDKVLSESDQRRIDFVKRHNYVCRFLDIIRARTDVLEQYVDALNQMPAQPMWWTYVANPELEDIWKDLS